ncbi:MAG: hypothetical protein ACE5F1_09595, partial [Planctomycetota bacterium]
MPGEPASTGAQRPRPSHYWTLPLALALAVVYWVYLYQVTTVNVKVTWGIVTDVDPGQAALGIKSEKTLAIIKPSRFTVTRITGPDEKPIKTVQFHFKGPQGSLKNVRQSGVLYVLFPDPLTPTDSGGAPPSKVFRLEDIRSPRPGLTDYLVGMEPEEIRVELEATGTQTIAMSLAHVVIQYPDPPASWRPRFFHDTITFTPRNVSLRGPMNLLSKIRDEGKIFLVDCKNAEEQLERLASSTIGNGRRPPVVFPVRLQRKFKGLTTSHEINAYIEIAPKPTIFPDPEGKESYRIDVTADWAHSSLEKDDYKITETVEIQIKSFNPVFSTLLKSEGENWVKRSLRVFVNLDEVEDIPGIAKPDF